MSNISSITTASPAGGTRSHDRSHDRANSAAAGESSGAGVKRERAIEVATSPPAMSQSDSQRSTPAASQGPDVKKRKSAPGSRGVANLTPEQLAKKRANGKCTHTLTITSLPQPRPRPQRETASDRGHIVAGP